MRRTLTVAALAAAMLVPAAAASADPGFNASCSNGKGGNAHDAVYNGEGNTVKAKSCLPDDPADLRPIVPTTPVTPEPEVPSEVS